MAAFPRRGSPAAHLVPDAGPSRAWPVSLPSRARREAGSAPRRTCVVAIALCLALVCWFAVSVAALAAPPSPEPGDSPAAPRVRLQPRFRPGDVLRYQIEFQTTSTGKTTGGIADPDGPSSVTVTWDALIRLEVLPAPHDPPSSAANPPVSRPVRLRTTYEQSVASVSSDSPDPQAQRIESEYAGLRGRSIEFTLAPDGTVSDIRGLSGILPGQQARSEARQWVAQLSGVAGAPSAGIVPGERWTSLQPAISLPLAGLVWRTESTYQDNELCRPANPAAASAPSESGSCAVILSRLVLLPPRSRRDLTPESYLRNGLHTAGAWLGTGNSLTYVSLRTGWVVSVTQTSTQQMDVTISRKKDESVVRYAGTVTTRSSVSLVPGSAPAAR